MNRPVPRRPRFASLATVKPLSLTFRTIMVLCAMNMLLAQLMGLHFHRHMVASGADHGVSLHLRDAGMHLHEDDAHHSATDLAAHPDEDLEIDPVGTGLAKFSKVWLSPTLLFIVMLCLIATATVGPSRFESIAPRPPALFALRPPSNAPPLEPSPV
jgi:hypothetical protein